jgi:hypothetical protein
VSEVSSAEQKALWALVSAIAGFVICGLLYVPALILANQALAVLDLPEVESGSRGMAIAAKWIAIVGLVLIVLGMIVWIAMMAISIGGSGLGLVP